MSIHSFELGSTIYSTLTGNVSLMSDVTGVFDDVPENTEYPYIVIGEETSIDNATKDTDGREYTIVLHIWSRFRGLKETKQIIAKVYDLLHNVNLSVTGASLVNIREEFTSTLMDSDGITRHGIMRFRVVIFDT